MTDLTTWLDLLGLLLVVAGVGLGLWPVIGGFALACAGAAAIGGSYAAARASK